MSKNRPEPSPARVVADADVLAADLLVDGHSRATLSLLRQHSWTTLVASDALLDDATAVISDLAEKELATDWRRQIEAWRERVEHPPADHPALASAYRGGAMHVLSLDERLVAPGTGTALNDRFPVSVRSPEAFSTIFDPAALYEQVEGSEYPEPDPKVDDDGSA